METIKTESEERIYDDVYDDSATQAPELTSLGGCALETDKNRFPTGERENTSGRDDVLVYVIQRQMMLFFVAFAVVLLVVAVTTLIVAVFVISRMDLASKNCAASEASSRKMKSEIDDEIKKISANVTSLIQTLVEEQFKNARRDVNESTAGLLSSITSSLEDLQREVNNISKMSGPIGIPGHNGSQGAAGPAGSTGPPGPKGAGNFSACQYKVVTDSVVPGGSIKAAATRTEPAGKRILGTTCSTNFAAEYNLLSQQQADGRWRYACSCRGPSTLFTTGGDKNCYLHYWECPLTT